jgi:phage terminase large subunit
VRTQKVQNRVILILNPATKEHWIYKRFFEQRGIESGFNGVFKDTTYIHTTYKDNKANLPDSFLQSIYEMKVNAPDKYEHQILGGWLEKMTGTVYSNWSKGNFVELNKTCFAQDYGFSNDLTTLVKISVDDFKEEIYVKECFGKSGMSTSQIGRQNMRYAENNLIIGDSSEPRLIKELRDRGNNVQGAKKGKGSILSGIALLQDYKIIVDPKSHGIIRELNHYTWKEKGSVPIDKYNHFLDALRMGAMFLVGKRNQGRYAIR